MDDLVAAAPRTPRPGNPPTPPAAGPDASTSALPSARAATARTRRVPSGDRGMTTAEYAVGTVAACGFGAVLYKAVTSDSVARLLRGVLEQALSVSFL